MVWITRSPNGTQIQGGEFSLQHKGDSHNTGIAEGVYNSHLSPSEPKLGAGAEGKASRFPKSKFPPTQRKASPGQCLQRSEPDHGGCPLPSLHVGQLSRTPPPGSSRLGFAVAGAEGGAATPRLRPQGTGFRASLCAAPGPPRTQKSEFPPLPTLTFSKMQRNWLFSSR